MWQIHEGLTNGHGTCTTKGTIGALYNPYAVTTTNESGYIDDCTSRRQQRCAMGDLSGKLGTLRLESISTKPHITYSFYDENIFLAGKYTSKFEWLLWVMYHPIWAACLNNNNDVPYTVYIL